MIRRKEKKGSILRWLLLIVASFWPIFLLGVTNSQYLYNVIPLRADNELMDTAAFHPFGPLSQTHQINPQFSNDLNKEMIPPTVVIFYHIYVPKDEDEESQNRAIQIIREQLGQVGDALTSIPKMHPSDLFYTTVGQRLQDGFVEEICNEFTNILQCHHLQHLDDGFEESTLTALHEYCQEHIDVRVIYLHSKGSYHYRQSQNNWRQHLTDAVTSRDCIQQAHLEDCELCGLLFLPRPSLHFTGNMFNAKCSYIQKLLNPLEFQKKLVSVVDMGTKLVGEEILLSNMIDEEAPCNNGLGRFAMEHWHGSHPSAQKICDVSTHYDVEYWEGIHRAHRTPEDWQFRPFPRHPHSAEWSNGFSNKLIDRILGDESKRKREYFLLPGQLMKWYELYSEFPPATSWVWSWYPDGQFWKQQVEKHGGNAVEIVSKHLMK